MSEASESGEKPDLESLQQAFASLRKLVQAMVIVMVVFSASINIFLLRQVTLVQNQIDLREQQLVGQVSYNEAGYVQLDSFLGQLRALADQHPEILPMIERHYPSSPMEEEQP